MENYFCSHPKFGEKISIDPHQLISGKIYMVIFWNKS